MSEQLKFEVIAPQLRDSRTFTVTVRVPVHSEKDQSRVLHYIRGVQLKEDLLNTWIRENAPGYGLEIRGGPRPVFKDEGNRGSGVTAYEHDFKLTRPI